LNGRNFQFPETQNIGRSSILPPLKIEIEKKLLILKEHAKKDVNA